eukprot:SM000136S00168  [mRNA]  locus=s136:113693:114832:- [translate_table: standard]
MTPHWEVRRTKVHAGDAEPSITELAHTVVEAVDAICTSSSFDVVGHQAGASVAMRVALTYPQRVRRLVLWGIPILDSTLREQLLQLQPPQPPDTRKNHPAAVLQSPHNRFPDQMQGWPVQQSHAHVHIGSNPLFEVNPVLQNQPVCKDRELLMTGFARYDPLEKAPAVIEMLQMREERAWLMQAAAAMDHEVALRAIQQPVLCMAGDSEVFQAATMRAASILPRGRYWHLRNGGTDVVDWYPEEYTRLIVDFLLKH